MSGVEEELVAAEARLMAGDVITSLDGRTIDSSSMLRRRLSGFEAGEDVSIGMTRAGQQVTPSAIKGHGDGGSSSHRQTTRFEERVAACDESPAAVDRR